MYPVGLPQNRVKMWLLVKESAFIICTLYLGRLLQNSTIRRLLLKECALLICTMYPGGLPQNSAVRQVLVKSVHLLFVLCILEGCLRRVWLGGYW